MANPAPPDKTYGARSYLTLSCPECSREVDLYIASAPVVGTWCACNDSAMEITYEHRWEGASYTADDEPAPL